MQGAKAFER
jgi:hypothetical protein